MTAAILSFALFAAVLTITPGLDTMFVVRTTAVSGRRAGFAAAIGIGLGCLAWAAASGLGITAVLTASDIGYAALRWAGAAYLCWLGARTWWHTRASRPAVATVPSGTDLSGPAPSVLPGGFPVPAGSGVPESGNEPARAPGTAFRVGLLTNLLNPKVGVFYLAVLPQFLPPGVNTLLASLILGAVHDIEGIVWFAVIILVVRRVTGWLTRPGVRRWLDRITAGVFVAFGMKLALAKASG